jgi:SAM-dependent methyltransferase
VSAPLYDALAGSYDEHFAAPHRRAYDDLAWEIATAVIEPGASVLDVGCGVGRWAERLVAAGHRVTGIEPAPRMADAAEKRLGAAPDPAGTRLGSGPDAAGTRPGAGSDAAGTRLGAEPDAVGTRAGPGFTLIRAGVEDADPPPADVVLAMGSLQYAADPVAAIARCAGWLRPGGTLCVLVDSRQALVLELLAAGRTGEALERSRTHRGCWRLGDLSAELHLFDAAELRAAVLAADLVVERLSGLLVGASAFGRAGLVDRLTRDYPGTLAVERRLAADPELADLGKQLIVVGRSPAR